MNDIKSNFFSKFQKHLQDAEKSFQKEAYILQDEVQKLNKVYQKKLALVDKLYESEEKKHTSALKALQSAYQKDTKTLTETAVEKTKNKEKKVLDLKAKWDAQQKTIEARFKDKLDIQKEVLNSTEEKRKTTEASIQKEYEASKKKLQRIKTATGEIIDKAQEPFLNSLRYYMNRLKDGSKDDLKYFKQEQSKIKKIIRSIQTSEAKMVQNINEEIGTSSKEYIQALNQYKKDIKSLNTKSKNYLTQTKRRFTETFKTFDESFNVFKKDITTLRKQIAKLIETNYKNSLQLLENYNDLTSKAEIKSLKELQITEKRNHETLTFIYNELFTWLDTLEQKTITLKETYLATYDDIHSKQDDFYNAFVEANAMVSSEISIFDASEAFLGGVSISEYKDQILYYFDALSEPLLYFQKQWHATLYKTYNEAEDYYKELDDIQAFYDGFSEEKAIAFENENVHITKKSAQLNIEIETAKKTYEVTTLDADQTILFEKKKTDFYLKIYESEKQLEKTRLNNTYRSKELEVLNQIKKAKADYNVKAAYFNIEKDLLLDKKNYQLATKKEDFGIEKLELIKQLTIEKNDLSLSQVAESDRHKVSIMAANNHLQKVKEEKRQFGLDLENKYQTLRNENIYAIQKQIDDHHVELNRIAFEEDKELRDIKQVLHDESLVARNRVDQFDTALSKRLQTINKPYKSSMKQIDKLLNLLNDPTTSYDEVVNVLDPTFKRELLLTLESYYETLKWTREYYSDLEISKIKRSSTLPKKQTLDIERHETAENKYKESLNTYLNVNKNKVSDAFDYFLEKIEKKAFSNTKELFRAGQSLIQTLIEIIQDQTTSVTEEVSSLFEYIKEQDLLFLEEIEYGAQTALDEIKTRYTELRKPVEETILNLKEEIKTIKSLPLVTPDTSEENTLLQLEQAIENAKNEQTLLENETYQKTERFKSEVQALELEYEKKQDQLNHQEMVALQNVESFFEQEKARIEGKISQAHSNFENIEASETQKLLQSKQQLDYGIQALNRKYDRLIAQDQEKLNKLIRQQEMRKVEAERTLSRTIDTIQKEISSKEIQLEAAFEKVNREYETLYFDKQTRAQSLHERLDNLQKYLFERKETLLNELYESLNTLKQKDLLTEKVIDQKEDFNQKFEAHQNYIDTFIEAKKSAFKESL